MAPSIRRLYAHALAEGEGVGTAYEYYVKRRVLRSILTQMPEGGTILIAGLPEKYGTSLDFVLAANDRRARVLVVDERESAIERAREALSAARERPASLEYAKLGTMTEVASLPKYDVALSCEVMQRLSPDVRAVFARALRRLAPRGAVFVPNAENESHTKISGLSGLSRRDLRDVMGPGAETGFVDMPPFPPGITRSAEQRQRASTGLFEATAMLGLQAYARAEPYVPVGLQRRVAHIVYAKWEP
jgi:hypothetical protein